MSVSLIQPIKLSGLVGLLEVLEEIDTSAPEAKTNEESIDDNNGGRIIL
ncbi:MAG TPA: hypothetical protein VFZ48_02015 [Candidatus Saccharimonadales bacterium]